MKHTAVLYTKGDCHLCERAKLLLERLQRDVDLDVEEVDITRDEALFEQYRYVIPVVVVDGVHRFEPNKLAEHYLRRVLTPVRPGTWWPWRR